MLNLFRTRRRSAALRAFSAPIRAPGLIYAIGDVHGRHDLLARLLERIRADAATFAMRPKLVFLGDYIDRGEGVRRTLDMLEALSRRPEVETVFLMGNHEQMLLGFLRDPVTGRRWLRYGGLQTLLSYGIGRPRNLGDEGEARRLRGVLIEALGPHLRFIERLALAHREGNLFFAHAGADPAVPPEEQEVDALLWGSGRFGKVERGDDTWIVHGHYVVDRPFAASGRIALDTGAYFSGRLSAARITGGKVAFLES